MRFAVDRLERQPQDEGLTGIVNGQEASDLEERVARALWKQKLEFYFQYLVYTAVSIPEEDKVVDFIIDFGGTQQAVEVDGEIGHKTMSQKEKDAFRDIFVNEALEKLNVKPIIRVSWDDLETQELADRTIRELI